MQLRHPKYWEAQAEECRALAVKLKDPQARRIMLNIAERYEELAERTRQTARMK